MGSQKQAQLRVGDAVLVKLKGGRGDMTAQKGKVKEVAGRGAFVELASGARNFFYLQELSRDESETKPLRIVPPKHLEPKSEPVAARPTFGQVLHAERVSRGLSPEALARAIGRGAAYLTNLERGLVAKADDELLLKLAEVLQLDLEQLEQANERAVVPQPLPTPEPALEAESAPAPTIAPVSEPPLPPPPQPETQAPVTSGPACASAPDFPDAYDVFIENLSQVVDLPREREKRKRWLGLARELYGLIGT